MDNGTKQNQGQSGVERAEHTPGPWKEHGATVYEADKWKDGNNLGGTCVALCYQPMADEMPSEEQFANARLIAAAPDLLAAVEAFLRAPHIGSNGPGSSTIEVTDFNLKAARAAIAKATGQAS